MKPQPEAFKAPAIHPLVHLFKEGKILAKGVLSPAVEVLERPTIGTTMVGNLDWHINI
jgi:hypothetical protein